MTEQEAIEYIENQGWSTTRLGLGRTRELLEKLGNPQKKLKFIHVAGSNGKGSTCAMLDAILRAAGYKVGLYTSPYIEEFAERMQVNGKNIPSDKLAALTAQVKDIAEKMDDHPSQFELVTAVGMQYFLDEQCDIVVLEVGMGGALDSTNAIDAPEVAVITNIGLEHTEYLGSTLEEIAETKSGIIKPGCDCVCYDGAPEVTAVVKRVCAEKGVPLHCVDFSEMENGTYDLSGQDFTWKGKNYHLNLLGKYQTHNASTVLTCVDALRSRGWNIPEEAVVQGLRTVKWPARLEVLGREPLFLLDGGHNPQCAEALAESVRTLLPGKRSICLLGVLADKDYPKMLDAVKGLAEEYFCLTPVSDRALGAEALADFLRQRGEKATAFDTPAEGVEAAIAAAGPDGAVIAFGSLYLAGAVRQAYRNR